MKIGASIGFQLIDIFNIMDDPSLTIEEKKQRIVEYQRSLQTLERGIRIKQDNGQNCKNGYYIFGNVDEMDYESLVNTKKYVDEFLTSFTCEGEMKMRAIIAGYDEQSHSIKYNFSLADKVYDYAMRHGQTMRGHTLVWHKHQPEALDRYIEDRLGCTMEEFKEQHPEDFFQRRKELTKEFLSEYMKTMGEHYPKCYCWDVLNEIVPQLEVHDSTNKHCPTEEERRDGLRYSKWFEYLGEEFYIDVLEIARANLPEGTKLFYNEFGEQHPEKRKAILQIIENIKQYEQKTGKVILDGIGLQSHYDVQMTPEQIKEIHREFAKTGKEIQITEADIAPGKDKDGNPIPCDPNNVRYEELWNTLYECAKEYEIQAFSGWGVNDDLSWFRDIFCTMVNKNGMPKEYAQVFLDRTKQESGIKFFHDQRSDEYFQDMKTGRYSISEQQIVKSTVNTSTTKKMKHIIKLEEMNRNWNMEI